jgi:hypothetical protein
MNATAVAAKVAEALAPSLPYLVHRKSTDGSRGDQTAKPVPVVIWEEFFSILQAHPEYRELLEAIAGLSSAEERQSSLIPMLSEFMEKQPALASRFETAMQEGDIKDSAGSEVHKPNEKEGSGLRFSRVVVVSLAGLLIGLFPALWTWFVSLSLSDLQRRSIVFTIGFAVLLSIYLYLRKLAQGRRPLEWFLNLTALITVISIMGLAPSLVFDRSAQVLLLKMLAIVLLALLPGWLYIQFVVVKGKSLRDEFVLDLFRLHADSYGNLPEPPKGSLFHPIWQAIPDKPEDPQRNMYLQKLQAAYGKVVALPHAEQELGRFQGDSFSPVILATIVLTIGWSLFFQPEVYGGFRLFGSLTLSGVPLLGGDALRYGFAGAYWYILQMLVRRFFQNDLKTAAYITVMTRVIIVALLVAVVHVLWTTRLSRNSELALAFIIGIFPQIGIKAVQSLIAVPLRKLIKTLENRYPLSDLDGLNIWYESRLVEEGIEDMQNLATANLIDLMLYTRVPVERLVDWVDQSILYLRVKVCNKDQCGHELCTRKLREFGIRTATDLESALGIGGLDYEGRAVDLAFERQEQKLEEIGKVLPTSAGAVWSILRTLQNEDNMWHVRAWRDYPRKVQEKRKGESPAHGAKLLTPAASS